MFRVSLVFALLSLAYSAPTLDFVNGGNLAITFKDCGDASTHAKVTSVTPPTIPLGSTTTVSGTGTLDKDIPAGTFDIKMTGLGGVNLLKDCNGDASKALTCKIGLFGITVGTMKFTGVTFPIKKGTISGIPSVDIQLSKSVPKSATTTTTTLTVVNGADKVVCVEIMTAPAADVAETEIMSPAYCLHSDDNTSKGKKCYEACSAGSEFKSKGFNETGKCSVHFNTVDMAQTTAQCPDGVTNLKYCKGKEVNVTFTTKGEGGHCYHNEDAIDHKCYEACSYNEFKMKGFASAGFCPDSYNSEEKSSSVRECPDGVTNLKYCQSTAVTVTLRTLGTKTLAFNGN